MDISNFSFLLSLHTPLYLTGVLVLLAFFIGRKRVASYKKASAGYGSKNKEKSVPPQSIEERFGTLPCDGKRCSLNDVCEGAERLFCRDVLQHSLGKVTISSQHTVVLPSGVRRIDFAFFTASKRKIAIELDGYFPHAKEVSKVDFDDQLKRQNELILAGWEVLRFSFNQLTESPQYCINVINSILEGEPKDKIRAFTTIVRDFNIPSDERVRAKETFKDTGAQYSKHRWRWYWPDGLPINETIPEHWTLADPITLCVYCQQKAIVKNGPYGLFGICQSCHKTFSLE